MHIFNLGNLNLHSRKNNGLGAGIVGSSVVSCSGMHRGKRIRAGKVAICLIDILMLSLVEVIDIFCSNPAVPNPVWIYNDIRSMFALVKAAGFVGPDFVLEAACREFLLENPLQFACSARIATSSGMAGRALINADEDMLLKLW